MPRSGKRRRGTATGAALLILLTVPVALEPGASSAVAVAPAVEASWASSVFSATARLSATINPKSLSTSYHFDYIAKAAYDANPPGNRFNGAARIPALSNAFAGAGSTSVGVTQLLFNLAADTVYHYRVEAINGSGTTFGPDLYFATFPTAAGGDDPCGNAAVRVEQNVKAVLADCRAWEMVSPLDKNGGRIDPPGTLAGGGVIQAAAAGGAVTYSSAASFGDGAAGATAASQYVGSRVSGGWSTRNITASLFSGSYDTDTGGSPYRLFSGDLARGLMLSGKRCRGTSTGCPVANPPLPGTDAPTGWQNYYLRDSGGGFEALLGAGDVAGLATDPADFSLHLAGTSPDLTHVVLSSCSPVAIGATDGCSGPDANLYKWSGGSLGLINSAPGAELAARAGAVSTDGARIYWKDLNSGDLRLRDGATDKQVDGAAGGGGDFQAASTDGSVAYYLAAGDLWRYTTASATSAEIAAGVAGVLGVSSSGSRVYFQDASGLKLWSSGSVSTVAADPAAADPSNYPPAAGTARVSDDGTKLLFVSSAPLIRYDGTAYDNADLNTKSPDSQVYLYETAAAKLGCLSCNPSNGRPIGASTIPGARHNGSGPDATIAYKPRVLVAGGQRVYFESADALVLGDTNNDVDVYQWEAQGAGDCGRAGGCVTLISSGRGADGASFADASADGNDAYFLTDESLVQTDPGSGDLYDARVGGGFPLPVVPIPCTGDSCRVLPSEPTEPTLTTLLAGPGNPPVRYKRLNGKSCRKGFAKRKGKCVRKSKPGKRSARRRSRR